MRITRITAMAIVTERFTAVLEELYGKKYSTSQVSRMFDYARKEKQISLAVKQTPKRAFSTSFHLSEIQYWRLLNADRTGGEWRIFVALLNRIS